MRIFVLAAACVLCGCGAARQEQLAVNNEQSLQAVLGSTKYFDGQSIRVCQRMMPMRDCINVSQGSASFLNFQTDERGRAIYQIQFADGRKGYAYGGDVSRMNDEASHRRARTALMSVPPPQY
jgi:hypothetical protein